ncbi:hypothetical protein [Methanogenium cariaci]|nr:hypothetical protein [Methanogenium cariaci]
MRKSLPPGPRDDRLLQLDGMVKSLRGGMSLTCRWKERQRTWRLPA